MDGPVATLITLLGFRAITNERGMAGVTTDVAGESERLIYVMVALCAMRLRLLTEHTIGIYGAVHQLTPLPRQRVLARH
jgi:hypothetical protein